MAETGSRPDPVPAFRFRVTLDDMAPAGFSDCSGLQVETEVHEYAEGGVNTNLLRFATRSKHAPLTLKRGIVDRALWAWHDDLVQGRVRRRNGTIAVFDTAGQQVVAEWQFLAAFPSRWVGPELAAGQSAVAIETLELSHQGLVRRG
jgi:phage tail-like protein